MKQLICTTCNSVYRLGNNEGNSRIRCKKCGQVIVVTNTLPDEMIPDFDSLFTALSEQERLAPTLEDSRIGVSS